MNHLPSQNYSLFLQGTAFFFGVKPLDYFSDREIGKIDIKAKTKQDPKI